MRIVSTKNSRGFALSEVLLVILVILLIGLIAWRIWDHSNGLQVKTLTTAGNGSYLTTDGNVGVGGDKKTVAGTTIFRLYVSYYDSVTGRPCPTPVVGFKGHVDINYVNNTNATVSITQNVKPQGINTFDVGPGCVDNTVEPQGDSAVLKSDWLQSSPKTKHITINGKLYQLVVNIGNYSVSLIGKNNQASVATHIPDDVVNLDLTEGCSNDLVFALISDHNIQLAEQKYPGLNDEMKRQYHGHLPGNIGTLVINDDYLRNYEGQSISAVHQIDLIPNKCSVYVITDPLTDAGPGGVIQL